MKLLLALALVASQEPIRWEPYRAELGGTVVEGAQLGRLTVVENRRVPSARRIDLAFVRLPGRAGGTPTVYLDGGPGGSGISVLSIPEWAPLLEGLRAQGDVILLSQRGTGLTRPRLVCGALPGAARGTLMMSRDSMLAVLRPSVDACVARWRDSVDLRAYNTEQSAADVADLARALGGRVNLLGFSYGTHLALAVLRSHSDVVARAVLAGTEGPDETYKLPSVLDTQLRRLSVLAAATLPDLYGTVERLLRDLERAPRRLRLADGTEVVLGADGMRYLLRADLGDSNDLPMLPALLRDALAPESPLLTQLVQRRFRGMTGGVNLMSLVMDCASGASPARMRSIESEYAAGFLGRMTDFPHPDVCQLLPELQAWPEQHAPVRSAVPTLFVSGTLDSNTPPHQAEHARWGFPYSAHIIVEHAGHESTLTNAEVQAAIGRFLATGELVSRFVTGAPLRFR